jgi:hypothetical protein
MTTMESMTGERLRRGSAWILASGVAAIAAIVSYSHIYDLGRAYGGSYMAARLLPLSVDLLILVGELMLLHESDARGRRFRPGWALVVSGIAATMAANVTFGAQFGAVGAVIWGWPAYSFVLVAWGMVAMVKRGGAVPADVPAEREPVPAVPEVHLNGSGLHPAEAGPFAAELARGRWPGIRRIRDELHVGQPRAQEIQARLKVLAGSNGHDAGSMT